MAVLGNFIWTILGGFWLAAFWGIWALLFIWSPLLRDAFFQIAKFSLLPFGKEIISREELHGAGSVSREEKQKIKLVNNIWIIFGLLASVVTVLSGIYALLLGLVLVVTIIFFPLGPLYFTVGVALMKMTKIVLRPVGLKVVSKKQALASAVVNEIERRQTSEASA